MNSPMFGVRKPDFEKGLGFRVIGVIMGVIMGLYWDYVGVIYRDNGKEDGNYYIKSYKDKVS